MQQWIGGLRLRVGAGGSGQAHAFRLVPLLLAGLLVTACSSTPSLPPGASAPDLIQDSGRAQPDEKELYLRIVYKLEESSQYYAAIAYLDRYERNWPPTDETVYLRAVAYRKTGNLAGAKPLYERLRSGRFEARAYEGLGLIDAEQGRKRESLRNFERAARVDPTNVDLLNNEGYAAMLVKDFPQAEAALFKAGQLGPQDKRVWSNIAVLEIVRNRQYQALRIMDRFQMSSSERDRIFKTARTILAGGSVAPLDGMRESAPAVSQGASLLQPRVGGLFVDGEGNDEAAKH